MTVLGRAIAQVSLEERMFPGGCALENGRWVKPGHALGLRIEGIGSLTNPIV